MQSGFLMEQGAFALTEATMCQGLAAWFGQSNPAGFTFRQIGIADREAGSRRRVIDFLHLRLESESGGPGEVVAVEVKISRSDFRSEVRNPGKQRPWVDASFEHYFAVPAGLVSPEEVPATSGLIEVEVDQSIRVVADNRNGVPDGVYEATYLRPKVTKVAPRRERGVGHDVLKSLLFEASLAMSYHQQWVDSLHEWNASDRNIGKMQQAAKSAEGLQRLVALHNERAKKYEAIARELGYTGP
ncbi:hypothetical protein M1843_19535 [Isoptericola sp. 4D.3]|uniref:Uncharacterized protein n=1 Tax=Isoptericola peretonis TaxID=2918523 RepID=A0ABT0J8Y7_9MICO|nr:hypothetical protein [Isoptericola sp. 4D.3]